MTDMPGISGVVKVDREQYGKGYKEGYDNALERNDIMNCIFLSMGIGIGIIISNIIHIL